MLGLALGIRLELRSGYVRVSAVLGQGKQFRLLKCLARIDAEIKSSQCLEREVERFANRLR